MPTGKVKWYDAEKGFGFLSREEGEDAVQHTFAAAYRDLTDSAKPIQLKAWLYTIARNRCLSIIRARREQVSIDDAEPSVDGLSAEVQRREDLRDMLRDLQALPEDQRAALVLSELGALTHEEVAETLGVRKDKVKALVFQARESLASSRTARDADCREIQEQLAVLRGGSLRRTTLRRHVEVDPLDQTADVDTVDQGLHVDTGHQPVDVAVGDMPAVLAQVGGDAVGAGAGSHDRGADRIGKVAPPRVADGRHVIDIDSEAQPAGHAAARLPGLTAGIEASSGGSASAG